jgi:hypothetical protein
MLKVAKGMQMSDAWATTNSERLYLFCAGLADYFGNSRLQSFAQSNYNVRRQEMCPTNQRYTDNTSEREVSWNEWVTRVQNAESDCRSSAWRALANRNLDTPHRRARAGSWDLLRLIPFVDISTVWEERTGAFILRVNALARCTKIAKSPAALYRCANMNFVFSQS